VQGTYTADCGWTVGVASVTYWPVGACGGVAKSTVVLDMCGNWSSTISGLTPGATYNVVVQLNFREVQMMTTAQVNADAATATAASCPP
jgi:hypothetical protein